MAIKAMTSKAGNEPLYIAIYSDLRNRIVSGEMGPGDILPSENELTGKYGVSRVTARQSLKQLESEGLVFSRPKRGYFVGKPQMDEFTVDYYKGLDDYRYVLRDVTVIVPGEEIRKALAIPPEKKVVVLPRIRYDDDFAFSYEIMYLPYNRGYPSVETSINFAAYPEMAAEKAGSFSFYTEMEMQVTSASGSVTRALDCPEGEPLMLIRRFFIRQGGERIGYGLNYMRSPYDKLHGVSGYRMR